MDSTLGTTTRRHILSIGLLALGSAFLPGFLPVQDVRADKKKKKKKIPSVADRTDAQREVCEFGGGKQVVVDGPNGGNTTECKGGDSDGWYCFNTKKSTKCDSNRTQDPSFPLNDVGGPPSDGVNEQPSNGKPVGGGGAVDPGPAEDPGGSNPGPIILLSERHATVDAADGFEARRNGKCRKRGNGKSRKR